MSASTILVQYSDGSPGRHLRVVLGFAHSGMTKEAYTDDRGAAVVEHSSVGEATVYVSGKGYHSFHAPGRTAVTI
jgi:hypothetical protein